MKLSFSLSSSKNTTKPSKSTSQDQSAKKEFVTEFDPSKTLPDSTSKPSLVIPPIPNQWRPQNKLDDPNLQFKADPNATVERLDSNFTYGLNLRGSDTEPKAERSESLSLIERLMLQKLRRDLERLPEDRGLEEFDNVSVEEFAPALLKGYGWYEGRGIGKNAKVDLKVVEYTGSRRTGKEGLGFVRTNDGDHRAAKTKNGVGNGEKGVEY